MMKTRTKHEEGTKVPQKNRRKQRQMKFTYVKRVVCFMVESFFFSEEEECFANVFQPR
jgi:hypothetical protein